MGDFVAVIQVAGHLEAISEVAVEIVVVVLLGVVDVPQFGQNFVSESILLLLLMDGGLLHERALPAVHVGRASQAAKAVLHGERPVASRGRSWRILVGSQLPLQVFIPLVQIESRLLQAGVVLAMARAHKIETGAARGDVVLKV